MRRDHFPQLGSRKHGLPLVESLALLPSSGPLARLRIAVLRRALAACGRDIEISQGVVFEFPERIRIGSGVFINRGVIIAGRGTVTIGSEVLIGPYVVIDSADHRDRDWSRSFRSQGQVTSAITIDDDVWIGAHAVLLKGVTLGRGCVVAAGAVVTHDVAPYTVVAGIPASPIRSREEPVQSRH